MVLGYILLGTQEEIEMVVQRDRGNNTVEYTFVTRYYCLLSRDIRKPIQHNIYIYIYINIYIEVSFIYPFFFSITIQVDG
jgi:hypothetical protein